MSAFGDLDPREVDTRLISEIKRLRQRGGVRTPRSGIDLDLFGARDWGDLRDILHMSIVLIEPFTLMQALSVALYLNVIVPTHHPDTGRLEAVEYDIGDTVIERRQWLSGRMGVSVRTLERREEAAAVLLAYQIQRLVKRPNIWAMMADVVGAIHTLTWSGKRVGFTFSPETHKQLETALGMMWPEVEPYLTIADDA